MKNTAQIKSEEVGAFEAKTHFSRLLRGAMIGKSFVITQRGKAVARLVPIESPKRKSTRGDMKGKIWMADDFDAPLDVMKEYME